MAISATIYSFSVELSDIDRGVYQSLELKLACHPSETLEYMLTRLLAYCLEYEDGIAFTDGISAGDEPAVLVRDLTGRTLAWIEVGAPDGDRLHRGAKQAARAAVYTHRDPAPFLAQLAGKKIHRAAELPVHALDRAFMKAAAAAIERRNTMVLSVTERQLYLDLNGKNFTGAIETHRLV